jgi:polyisoprenoid-binding protein YceI
MAGGRHRPRALAALAAVLLALPSPSAATGRCSGAPLASSAGFAVTQATLRVDEGTAIFRASSRLGDFSGRTTALSGEVSGATPDVATGWVDVALDSLRTGNGRRDRHMREAFETGRHPRARFALDSLRRASATDSVILHGRFTVHGVTRATQATGTLSPGAGGAWRLSAGFPVSLSAHDITKGISRLGGLLAVSDTVRVEVVVMLAPVGAHGS